MTSIQAAEIILREFNKPMTAKKIASEILQRKLVHSEAKDQTTSIAATILKSINNYDDAEVPLSYWNDVSKNKLIGLKEWREKNHNIDTQDYDDNSISKQYAKDEKVSVLLPKPVVDKLKFTYQSNIKNSFEDYVVYIVDKGLEASEDEIKQAFSKKIKEIYGS